MTWDWRADLSANSKETCLSGAIKAFILAPSFTFVAWTRLFMYLKNSHFKFSGVLSSLIHAHIVKTFSCEINYQVNAIGVGLCVPHPIGIVIGGNATIGNDVTIFQNVTIGRKTLDSDCQIDIGSGSKLFAGAVILGPINLGKNCSVGANAVVLKNVAENETVYGIPAKPFTAPR